MDNIKKIVNGGMPIVFIYSLRYIYGTIFNLFIISQARRKTGLMGFLSTSKREGL
jgi:hypothetical protein